MSQKSEGGTIAIVIVSLVQVKRGNTWWSESPGEGPGHGIQRRKFRNSAKKRKGIHFSKYFTKREGSQEEREGGRYAWILMASVLVLSGDSLFCFCFAYLWRQGLIMWSFGSSINVPCAITTGI